MNFLAVTEPDNVSSKHFMSKSKVIIWYTFWHCVHMKKSSGIQTTLAKILVGSYTLHAILRHRCEGKVKTGELDLLLLPWKSGTWYLLCGVNCLRCQTVCTTLYVGEKEKFYISYPQTLAHRVIHLFSSLRQRIFFRLRPRDKKYLLAPFLKTNSQFALYLATLIHKWKITIEYDEI